MKENELIKLEENFHYFNGELYKIDFFGDLLVKNEFGGWQPVL